MKNRNKSKETLFSEVPGESADLLCALRLKQTQGVKRR